MLLQGLEWILEVTSALPHTLTMPLVPAGATYMRPLKGVFVFLLVFSTVTMWYITFSSHTVLEKVNLMYFYEYEPVYRQSYPFTLLELWKCHDIHPFLVILVASRPRDVRARQAIRITWGSQSSWWGQPVLTLFLLGQDPPGAEEPTELSVEDENVLYGDTTQQDFRDIYDKLTLKTIMGFRWLSEFCPNTTFLTKTDSDGFIHTPNLGRFLLSHSQSEQLFIRYPLVGTFAYRGLDRTRSISCEEYPFRLYPPAAVGWPMCCMAIWPSGFMSSWPVKFEDVYVGICLNLLKVNVSVPEDAEQFFLYKINVDVCKDRHLIAVHGLTPSELISFWQDLSASNSMTCLRLWMSTETPTCWVYKHFKCRAMQKPVLDMTLPTLQWQHFPGTSQSSQIKTPGIHRALFHVCPTHSGHFGGHCPICHLPTWSAPGISA